MAHDERTAHENLPLACQLADALFVATQCKSFVEAAVELALEFAQCPVLAGGFDFVEAALVGILDAEQEDVVRPTERKRARTSRF